MTALKDLMNEPPRVEIVRTGRWMHEINIHHRGTERSMPWHALGRAHAERKAKRLLRRYLRNEERRATPLVIRPEDV